MPSILLTLTCGVVTQAAALTLGDSGLSVVFNEEGRIAAVRVAAQELLVAGQVGGLSAYDVGQRQGPVDLRGRVEPLPDGARLLYDCAELGLAVAVVVRSGPRHVIAFDMAVDDERKLDRGLTLEFALPLGTTGWTWWDEPDVSRAVQPDEHYTSLTRLRELPGLPEFDDRANLSDFGSYSWYPVAAVTGKSGLGLARPPRAACLFRTGFDGRRGVLYCAFDFALSQDTKRPGHADFSWVLFPIEPAQGFRGALAELYELWPEDFRSRVPDYGGWMPFRGLREIPNVDEFGFAYQEGASQPAFDDILGVSSFAYFHCAGEFANIPGYNRQGPLPPYEEQLAALNTLIKQRTGMDRLWDITGLQLPDGRIDIRPEATYGHIFSQACVDPELPFGRFMADDLTRRVLREAFPKGIDGVYYDGLAMGMDYSREHFKTADHPLLWNPQLGRPVAYNFFASLEWAEEIAATLRPHGKLTMLNDSSLKSFPFVFPYIDVLGAEGGWVNSDADFLRTRAYAYHKPFCTLLKTDYSRHPQAKIETYMRSCLAFGHLFGFFDISPSGAHPGSSYWEHPEWFDRDRPLFRRYMPLCAELCRAGWEPVQLASTPTPGARVERFGGGRYGNAGDPVYFTIRRAASAQEGDAVSLEIADAVACAHSGDAIAVDLLTGETQWIADGRVTVTVPAKEVGVIAAGSRAALVRRCAERALRLIESRQRYLQAITAPVSPMGAWAGYMTGAEVDSQVTHSGRGALRASSTDPAQSAGAVQGITLNQTEPEDLIVRAWSKAEKVSGNRDAGYSIYVDCYYRNGDKLYGQTVEFDPGSHEWQRGEIVIRPTAAIGHINVYCMFRHHTGTVWFDDVFVARASQPEVNLLKNGDFEPPEPLPPNAARAAVEALCASLAPQLQQLRAAQAAGEGAIASLVEAAETARQQIERLPGDADSERALRDVTDLHHLLQLAAIIAEGRPSGALWPQRLTPPSPLAEAEVGPAAPRTVVASAQGRVPPGTRVTVDSNFSGYDPSPLTDGKINPQTERWAEVAWASEDEPMEHWIRLDFPAPQLVSGVVVHWALDAASYWRSRNLVIEVPVGDSWAPVSLQGAETNETGSQTSFVFAPLETRTLRLRQPLSGGPAARPNIMWVSEVEVTGGRE